MCIEGIALSHIAPSTYPEMTPGPSTNEPKFAHRENANGTFDSICLRCFRTVATARSESALREKEQQHACDLEDLHAFDPSHG